MSTPDGRQPQLAGDWYEIRIKGHLGPRWATGVAPMTLSTEDGGTTLIQGPVVDQAALHGLLHQLSDLGLPLISVAKAERLPAPNPQRSTHTKEQS